MKKFLALALVLGLLPFAFGCSWGDSGSDAVPLAAKRTFNFSLNGAGFGSMVKSALVIGSETQVWASTNGTTWTQVVTMPISLDANTVSTLYIQLRDKGGLIIGQFSLPVTTAPVRYFKVSFPITATSVVEYTDAALTILATVQPTITPTTTIVQDTTTLAYQASVQIGANNFAPLSQTSTDPTPTGATNFDNMVFKIVFNQPVTTIGTTYKFTVDNVTGGTSVTTIVQTDNKMTIAYDPTDATSKTVLITVGAVLKTITGGDLYKVTFSKADASLKSTTGSLPLASDVTVYITKGAILQSYAVSATTITNLSSTPTFTVASLTAGPINLTFSEDMAITPDISKIMFKIGTGNSVALSNYFTAARDTVNTKILVLTKKTTATFTAKTYALTFTGGSLKDSKGYRLPETQQTLSFIAQ